MADSRDKRKRYILFVGVNGVGKSTLNYLHPELQNAARINMDEIAKGLGSWKDISVVLEAGKRAIRLREKYLEDEITFNHHMRYKEQITQEYERWLKPATVDADLIPELKNFTPEQKQDAF